MTKEFSRLIFGSMRMHERGLSEAQWVGFLAELHARGVDTLHSSVEYESFGLFCRVVGRLRLDHGLHFRHVVKLAAPHFDEQGFDLRTLDKRVDAYLEALGVDVLDCIQWMWRSDLQDDAVRCEKFRREASGVIADGIDTLKARGRISRVGCFPYTPAFAELVLRQPWIDSLVVYRNPLEKEYDAVLDAALQAGKDVIALRPFAAGKLFDTTANSPADALNYCFGHDAVGSAVLTLSSLDHVEQVREFLKRRD